MVGMIGIPGEALMGLPVQIFLSEIIVLGRYDSGITTM